MDIKPPSGDPALVLGGGVMHQIILCGDFRVFGGSLCDMHRVSGGVHAGSLVRKGRIPRFFKGILQGRAVKPLRRLYAVNPRAIQRPLPDVTITEADRIADGQHGTHGLMTLPQQSRHPRKQGRGGRRTRRIVNQDMGGGGGKIRRRNDP